MMEAIKTEIDGLFVIEPKVFGDDRGFFFESYNKQRFEALTGCEVDFVQDNHSKSVKGVLRGLHYQLAPKAQGKLVRVISGEVYDVAVDLRRHSATFGKWLGIHLSASNKRQLWIPEGFAHGFLVLSDEAEFLYKTTNLYSPDLERSIRWNDDVVGVNWPIEDVGQPVLSEKDAKAPLFAQADIT